MCENECKNNEQYGQNTKTRSIKIQGDDIDSIEYYGSLESPRSFIFYIKNGDKIQVNAELNVSSRNITPFLNTKIGKWGRIE